ncbi:hypothetical protein BDV95DRAFT_628542 [Massariosphaeria phaeospora]|uniref:Cytochrome oxidase c assembly-domain-containing protein n=1 Tax=Massariosphaeria phaeospora TaxID=100035 RepID=A0A7C8MAK1_9PLEO|nr:hypothetical protein BDV95DRAFT_628542 [Massariosphaeria phaeospora]
MSKPTKDTKDSTRFTATGVWAHTKPGGRSTTLQFAEPAPKNETPQQKVKRLREAANRAKMAQITRWDYAYLYGRIAADAAHRTFVYGIIFSTGLLGVLAVFSIGDMVVYNRRKRAIYFQEQEKDQANILSLARSAVLQGSASPAQAALVEGIAEEERLMDQKKAERKVGSRLLWWFHGEWNEEKDLKEQRRLAVEDFRKKEAEALQGKGVTQAVQDARAASHVTAQSNVQPTVGGPLDQAASETTGKGWLGWAFGGSKKE